MYAICNQCGEKIKPKEGIHKYELTFCSEKCIKQFKNNIPKLYNNQKFIGSKLINIYSEIDNMGKKRYFGNLLCDCGNNFSHRRDYIRKQLILNKTLSCGCQRVLHEAGKKSHKWTGYGDISGQYFSTFRCKANKKQIPFEISIEYIWDLFLKQNKKCAYTNLDLKFAVSRRLDPEQTASLDRIDSSKGYIENNIQWVHKNINYMKRTMSHNEFIKFCKLVAINN